VDSEEWERFVESIPDTPRPRVPRCNCGSDIVQVGLGYECPDCGQSWPTLGDVRLDDASGDPPGPYFGR
jgi:hypothetical protein